MSCTPPSRCHSPKNSSRIPPASVPLLVLSNIYPWRLRCRQELQQVAFAVLRAKTQSASVLSSLHRLLTLLRKRVTTALPCTVVLPCHRRHALPIQLGGCVASALKGYHVRSFPRNTARLDVRLSPTSPCRLSTRTPLPDISSQVFPVGTTWRSV